MHIVLLNNEIMVSADLSALDVTCQIRNLRNVFNVKGLKGK